MSKLLDSYFEFLGYATDKGFWHYLVVIFLSFTFALIIMFIFVFSLAIVIHAIPYAWVVIVIGVVLYVIYTFVKLLIEYNK